MLPAGAAQQQGALEGHLVLPRSGLGPAIPWQHPPVAQTRDGRHLRRVGPGLICWVLQERLRWLLLQQIGPFKIWEVQRLLQAPGLPLAPPWLLTLRFCCSQGLVLALGWRELSPSSSWTADASHRLGQWKRRRQLLAHEQAGAEQGLGRSSGELLSGGSCIR